MVNVFIKGDITITGLSAEHKNFIKSGLRLKNPTYYQAIRANPRAKYAISEFIEYFKEDKTTGDITIDRGKIHRLLKFLRDKNIPFNISDNRVTRKIDIPKSSIKLREYQSGIPEEISRSDQGVVVLSTGFGKTIIALRLAEILQQKTLIIVPRISILKQFKDDYVKYFKENPGIINGGECSVKNVTLATKQSLANWISKSGVECDKFGCIIVDECHLFVPKKSRGVINFFTAHYRFGFTATDRRSDGQGDAIRFIFGDTIIQRNIERKEPSVEILKFDGHIPMDEYHNIIDEQSIYEERNKLIARRVEEEISEGRRVLVLTKRINHAEILYGFINNDGKFILRSSDSKKKNDIVISELRSGIVNFSCILGTMSLLSVGVDIPLLDTLIIAGDLKSDVLQEQSVGRVLRIFEGKKDPKIIDIWDTGNPILKHQGKLRQKFYNKQGWNMTQ